jgi:hypothetical protein
MRFASEIMRGVRLAAFVFALALIGLTLYRMVDSDTPAAATAKAPPPPPAKAPEPVHSAKSAKAQEQVPPPPPPAGAAPAVRAKRIVPAAQPKDTVLVALPEEQQSLAKGEPTQVPVNEPPANDVAARAPEPATKAPVQVQTVADATPKTETRTARMVKSMRRFFRIGQ